MTGKPLTDAEVICSWMEPRPSQGPLDFRPWLSVSPGGWWIADPKGDLHPYLVPNEWHPRPISLNECHEGEARLTDQQWREYSAWLATIAGASSGTPYQWAIHADAPTKVAALAPVLRPLLEGCS